MSSENANPSDSSLSPFTPVFLGLQTDVLMKQATGKLALLRSTDSRDTVKMWEEIENLPRMTFRTAPVPRDWSQTM